MEEMHRVKYAGRGRLRASMTPLRHQPPHTSTWSATQELSETYTFGTFMEAPSCGMEKEMATHCSILAWRISWTEEPDRLQSTGSQESDTTYRLNHHHYHVGWRIISSVFSLFPFSGRWGQWAESSKLLIMAQCFGGPAPISTKSHLIRTKDTPSFRRFQGI